MSSSSIVFREAPISGHVFRRKRKSGDRWMAKWRDGEGQHQAVLGKAWTKRGRPAEGYLTKQGAQRELDAILADARRHRITSQPRLASTVTFALCDALGGVMNGRSHLACLDLNIGRMTYI